MSRRVDAVIFDWGGTLTPWHPIDPRDPWRAYARAYDAARTEELADALHHAEEAAWGRQRASAGASGTGHLDHLFAVVDVDTASQRHADALGAYHGAWDPHTYTDPDVPAMLDGLRADGIAIGVLSNTLWPRAHHESVFERDGVADLIDGAVYTSEIAVGKPHADEFLAALAAVGVSDPARAVFVGDRPWDDVHGAQQVGMRAILVPHSDIPLHQQMPVEVVPDAVVTRLADVLPIVRAWNAQS
jgi:putative hydrolase of the HAD superfamily